MEAVHVKLEPNLIADLCRRWRIHELSLFGSVLRDDFHSESDVDVLVSFDSNAPWSLWDLLDLRKELGDLFGRDIDLVEERSLINPYRRRSILRDKRVIYAAQ
jgi:predicted nucleotidyltransferase